MSVYARTEAQKRGDFLAARDFENLVGEALGPWKIERLDATDDLDFWVPGFYIEVKEKRQKLTARWQVLDGVPERDLFVLDELTVRRALRSWPYAYFVIRDVPGGDRLFLPSITDVLMSDRIRRNRNGKGKWIVNLQQYRRLPRLDDIPEIVMADLVGTPWKRSECLALDPVPEV